MDLAGSSTDLERARSRIRSLRWRIIATGFVAGGLLLAGFLLAVGVAGDLIRWWTFAAGALPLVHIPAELVGANGLPLVSWLFFLLGAVGLWGMSTGRLRRVHVATAFAVMLACGLADWLLASPTHQVLLSLPSRIERLVGAGSYDEAERLLDPQDDAALAPQVRYLRAQIAYNSGDLKRVAELASPLLETVDFVAYQPSPDPFAYSASREMVGTFRIDVLARLDRAIHHGTGLTAVSLLATKTRSTEPDAAARLLAGLLLDSARWPDRRLAGAPLVANAREFDAHHGLDLSQGLNSGPVHPPPLSASVALCSRRVVLPCCALPDRAPRTGQLARLERR